MKPDIELCAELLEALRSSPDYKGLEGLSKFFHNFKLADAYESQTTEKKKYVKLYGSKGVSFKDLVDERGIRSRLDELDSLVPVAAMIVGFRTIEAQHLRADDRKSQELKELEGRVSQHDTALQGIGAVQGSVDALSTRVEKLQAPTSILDRAAGKQHWKMMAVAMLAFALTLAMIGYGFYWGIRHGDPDISIDLDIGQLVGGTLVGIGALLAGGAYALATLRRLKVND